MQDEDVCWQLTSPRQAALRILAGRFGRPSDVETSVPLAEFQRDSVLRASAILDRRGGVIIADSVGLGKTFVALALMERALRHERDILVVIPAALRRMWRAESNRLTSRKDKIPLVSHSQLARSLTPAVVPGSLIVVDEAHAFRNPGTRRYRVLRRLCTASQVVLLTATPINNSLSDLYFQLRLFCSDSAFRDLGIGSLRSLLRRDARPDLVARLRQAVVVRRTRAEARAALSAAPVHHAFRFPRDMHITAVTYALAMPVAQIGAFIQRLSFPAYHVESARQNVELLRFGLLKRLESSRRAIQKTLRHQIRFYERFIAGLQTGILLRPRDFRDLYTGDECALQLVFDAIAFEPQARASDKAGLLDRARSELHLLEEWQASITGTTDHKLSELAALLDARRSRKTIVFTEFRDTARYLWSQLRGRFPVALIDGGGAWIGETPTSRRHAVDCFAPVSNRAARVHAREAVSVLIATDVLAEGMNLQDADAVVSYDLPWNPVRLIQRAGRVDRMGSAHDVVHIYNFLPDREFDAFLGLARTIRNKLETVRNVIGVERPVLEPEEDFEEVVRRLAANDQRVLEQLDGGREAEFRVQFNQAADACETLGDGVVPVARLGAGVARRLILGMVRGSEFDSRMVDVVTVRELAEIDAVLLEALKVRASTGFDFDAFLELAKRIVAAANGQRASAGLATSGAPARIARAIRNGIAPLTGDQNPELFARADRALEMLSNVNAAGVEDALTDLASYARTTTLPQTLAALEMLFLQQAKSPRPTPRWRLTALIVSD